MAGISRLSSKRSGRPADNYRPPSSAAIAVNLVKWYNAEIASLDELILRTCSKIHENRNTRGGVYFGRQRNAIRANVARIRSRSAAYCSIGCSLAAAHSNHLANAG